MLESTTQEWQENATRAHRKGLPDRAARAFSKFTTHLGYGLIIVTFLPPTRADLFEKRKQQHIERGYRIEDERPVPVNGFCSFIAIRETRVSDALGELVAQALNGNHSPRGND